MSLVLINVGIVANDHTGDPFRTAFQKTNNIINALNNGPVTIGPPVPAANTLVTINGGSPSAAQQLVITGNTGYVAGMSIAANGYSPGNGSFDIWQAANGFPNLTSSLATANLNITMPNGVIINAPTTTNVTLTISGSAISNSAVLKLNSNNTQRMFNMNATSSGGYMSFERAGVDKAFIGDSNILGGGTTDDYTLKSFAGLYLYAATAGIQIDAFSSNYISLQVPTGVDRFYVTSSGCGVNVPASGIAFTVKSGTLWNAATPGIAVLGDGGAGAGISICANGTTPNAQSFDFYQGNAGDATIAQRANSTLTFLTNNSTALSLAANHNATFTAGVGLFSNAPPAQITGFGSPVGGAVINNYNITDAGGANSNTNKCVAEIIAALKAFGLFGA